MIRDKITSSPACALCGAKRKLEQSHIIPQFVYRWAKASVGQSAIPAGPTRPMLCGQCEDLISTYESEFARHVFHPLAMNSTVSAKYGAWLRKFAASVCWRILEERAAVDRPGHCDDRWAPALASGRETWQQYLRGKRPDVGPHQLHLVCLETNPHPPALGATPLQRGIKPSLTKIPSGEGCPTGRRGWEASIASEVSCTDHTAFVYAKLGPLILFGLIAEMNPKQWQGTRLNAEGKLKPRAVVIPAPYRDYLASRACGPT